MLTSAMLRDGRRSVPAKIRLHPPPRMFLYEVSPITQRSASQQIGLAAAIRADDARRPGDHELGRLDKDLNPKGVGE